MNPWFRCFSLYLAHISGAEFQYPDLTWKEMCGQMAHLVADSGNNKGQLGNLVEAICRDFRQHDEEEMKKLVEWSRLSKTRGANKEKPARPDTAILFPPTDTTRAGFLLISCRPAARTTANYIALRWREASEEVNSEK